MFAISCAVLVIGAGVLAVVETTPLPNGSGAVSPPVAIHRALVAARGDPTAEIRAGGPNLTVYTPSGTLVATSMDRASAPLDELELEALRREHMLALGRHRVALGDFEHDQLRGYGIIELTPPPLVGTWLALALGAAVLALLAGSIVFARHLVRPLHQLQAAALAFGDGNLAARTHLAGSDEIQTTGAMFDAMADRIARLMRAQRELIANVAHELRTPMARIRMALDLAQEGDDALARSILGEIDHDLQDLERLVENVMTSARLELSALRPRREPLDIAELLATLASRTRAWGDGREVRVELVPGLAGVEGDVGLLGRALGNLIENARLYSEPATPITLRAGRGERGVYIEVVDRGIGIAPADLPHVMSEFFRGERSRSRATGGAGLGLSLASKIVTAHGGQITIESTVGVGTTVRIELPG